MGYIIGIGLVAFALFGGALFILLGGGIYHRIRHLKVNQYPKSSLI